MEEIVTGDAVVLDLPCARFPTRMLAHLIDMCVQVPLLIIILAVVAAADLNSAWVAAVFLTGYVLVIVGYPLIFETLSRGRTLGKMALGLRVVADDGGPERFRQALVRALAGAVECWILFGVPALITSLFSFRGKRLGDIFAGTFALRERAPRPAMVSYPAPGYLAPGTVSGVGPVSFPPAGGIVPPMTPALIAWAASLDLSALPDHLAASATSYLTRYIELHSPAREQLGLQLAADVAARVSPASPPGMPPVYYLGIVLAERRRREYARLAPAPGYPGPPSSASPAAPTSTPAASTAAESPTPVVASPTPEPGPDSGFAPPV